MFQKVSRPRFTYGCPAVLFCMATSRPPETPTGRLRTVTSVKRGAVVAKQGGSPLACQPLRTVVLTTRRDFSAVENLLVLTCLDTFTR